MIAFRDEKFVAFYLEPIQFIEGAISVQVQDTHIYRRILLNIAHGFPRDPFGQMVPANLE